MFLAKELVKISPDLDVDKTCGELVLLNPPWTSNGSTARRARARYTGPLTPALISYISGEAGIPTESIAQELFFRPAVTGEPFIWIKPTPQFRAFMAIMVNCGLTTAEIELLLKKAVDSTAADYGLPPTVDVRLYDCQFVNNKQNKKTRDLRIVGIENHGVGRIICPNDRYCATLLRKISSVPVSVSIAQNLGFSMNRIDILRVIMDLSARRKRRRRTAAHGGAGGDSEDDDDDHGNGDAVGDHARLAVVANDSVSGENGDALGDGARAAEAAGNSASGNDGDAPGTNECAADAVDYPVSGDDSDALGDEACAAEAADDPVSGEDGDALGDDARAAEAADNPFSLSSEDSDALGDGARAAEAVDDPVCSEDGDALGDYACAAEVAHDLVTGDVGDALGDDARAAEAAGDQVSGDDSDALGDDACAAEAADDPVSCDDDDALCDDARTGTAADDLDGSAGGGTYTVETAEDQDSSIVDVLYGGNAHMMETASDTVDGPECSIGARVRFLFAELLAEPCQRNNEHPPFLNIHCNIYFDS